MTNTALLAQPTTARMTDREQVQAIREAIWAEQGYGTKAVWVAARGFFVIMVMDKGNCIDIISWM